MNREIKFRAWDKRFKTMSFGAGDLLLRINEKDFSEPMQFTGLKDKNGKDIYEGDIIDFKHHKGYLLDDCVGVMEWIVCEYVIKTSSFVKPVTIHLSIIDELQEDLLNHIEVIGSIYENPELITNTPSI